MKPEPTTPKYIPIPTRIVRIIAIFNIFKRSTPRTIPMMKMTIMGMPVGRPNTVSPVIISMIKSHNSPLELRIDDKAVFSPQVNDSFSNYL